MTQSKSEKLLGQQNLAPIVSNTMYKQVSQYRRGTLAGEVEQGLYRDGTAPSGTGLSRMGDVVLSPGTMHKTAQVAGPINTGYRGPGDTARQIPEVYSPLWLNTNLNLPRDRATINAWCRSFYALHPEVQNAINLHSTYPISKLTIKCPNRKVEKFFNDMIEEIGLIDICSQIAQEYWLLGEAFVYAELDERKAKWSRLIIQNPDYIVVKRSVIANEPLIMLRPDENLRRITFSNKPGDIEQRRQLNETIVEHIKRGENIPLDNFYVSHLARKISPYEARGTGLPVSCFRALMIMDQMRESKYVQSVEMINPMTIVKIGGEGNDALHPTHQDLEAWREVFAQAEYDRDFKIITHAGVNVERVGYNQAVMDTLPDIQQLLKEIYMGLMVPEVIMAGSGDVTYANGGVALDVLRSRYMSFRNMLSNWLRKKIFAPISKLNEFYDHEDGEKVLIVPEVDWSHMSVFDTMDYINVLVQLSGEQKKVSQQTLYRSLGLEYDEEQRKIKKEDIRDAVRKKEIMSLDRMALNDLRALSDDDDIPEIAETPGNPADSPYTDQGQQAPGGPGGDMGLGSLPGVGGGPGLGGGSSSPLPPLPSPTTTPPAGGGPTPSAK